MKKKEDIMNISNKEKEILESYSDISTNTNSIKENDLENSIDEISSSSEKETKKKRFSRKRKEEQEETNEIEEFEIDEVKDYSNNEIEEEPKTKPKKEKESNKKLEEFEMVLQEEYELEEFEIEDSTNSEPLDYDSIYKNSILNKLKEKSNLIINLIFLLIIILILLAVIDIIAVAKYEKGPYFSLPLKTYKDGGTKEYYGLGYKVIKYNQRQGRRDIEIGTWALKYNIEPIYLDIIDLAIETNNNEIETYNKYYKKFLRVSGTLQKIDTNDDTLTISYIDEGGKYNLDVICYMEQGEDISKYEVYEEITAIGTMHDYKFKSKNNNATIEMKNCFAEQ